MAYQLKEVTLRTDNSPDGMEKIAALWKDIETGKLPLLFDSEGNFLQGLSPVSLYSNYESAEKGEYDLSIRAVTADFSPHWKKTPQTENTSNSKQGEKRYRTAPPWRGSRFGGFLQKEN